MSKVLGIKVIFVDVLSFPTGTKKHPETWTMPYIVPPKLNPRVLTQQMGCIFVC
jgi:hypothetical protein